MKRVMLMALMALAVTAAKANVPEALRPADGQRRALELLAAGVQVYECDAGQWKFKGPVAILMDAAGRPMGTHFGGPTWKANDGSEVVAEVKARAPAAEGAIPLLLLGAKPHSGMGMFERVSSIQRLETEGGVAPRTACAARDVARVPYTATYVFFVKAE